MATAGGSKPARIRTTLQIGSYTLAVINRGPSLKSLDSGNTWAASPSFSSYAVARRTREIGIRLAIGATPARVRLMVIGEGLRLAGAGVAFGLLIGAGMGRIMDSVFVDVQPFDAVTFSVAPLLLLGACAAAAWFPARRATTVNPVTALRAD